MPVARQPNLPIPREAVLDRQLTSSDVRVLAVLVDKQTTQKRIEVGLESIAHYANVSARTVSDCLKRLETRGYILRQSRRGPTCGRIELNSDGPNA